MSSIDWLREQLQSLKLWRSELLESPCEQSLRQVEQLDQHRYWLEVQLSDLTSGFIKGPMT